MESVSTSGLLMSVQYYINVQCKKYSYHLRLYSQGFRISALNNNFARSFSVFNKRGILVNSNKIKWVLDSSFTFSRNTRDPTKLRKLSRSVNRLVTSAICNAPPGLSIRHASRRHVGQLTPIRLRAQTTTSTTCPSPEDFASLNPSEPGKGIFSHMSASTTYPLSDTRSNETTQMPFGTRLLARTASPHPRSAMTVFWG